MKTTQPPPLPRFNKNPNRLAEYLLNILVFATFLLISLVAFWLDHSQETSPATNLPAIPEIVNRFLKHNSMIDAAGVFLLLPGAFVIGGLSMLAAKQKLRRGEISESEYGGGIVALAAIGVMVGGLLLLVFFSY